MEQVAAGALFFGLILGIVWMSFVVRWP